MEVDPAKHWLLNFLQAMGELSSLIERNGPLLQVEFRGICGFKVFECIDPDIPMPSLRVPFLPN